VVGAFAKQNFSFITHFPQPAALHFFVIATFECRTKSSPRSSHKLGKPLLEEVRRVGTTADVNETETEPNWLSPDGFVSDVIDGNPL
jgi:hypothetical protein